MRPRLPGKGSGSGMRVAGAPGPRQVVNRLASTFGHPVVRLYWDEASTSWPGRELLSGWRSLLRGLQQHPTRVEVRWSRRPINAVIQWSVGRFGRYPWFRTSWLKWASDQDWKR